MRLRYKGDQIVLSIGGLVTLDISDLASQTTLPQTSVENLFNGSDQVRYTIV